MDKKIRSWQIFGISLILLMIWLIIINLSYSTFQNTRNTDALAEVKVLFPYFYIVIALFALLCIYVFWRRIDNKRLHIALLVEFALMLWFTPYLMSGFVREPDGLWYSGVSLNIQSVLSGISFRASEYAVGYPASFLFNRSALVITGTNVIDYAGWLYPLFYTVIFVFLWYIFASRFFNNRSAFLSGIIAIPALHYLKIHPSPQTLGVILILLTLILLITHESIKCRVLGIVALLIMIITHPVSTILTVLFLGVAYLPKFLFEKKKTIFSRKITIALIAIAVIAAFILFLLFTSLGQSIIQYIQRMLSYPLDRGFDLLLKFIVGSPFIYPEIYLLNQLIYIGYVIMAIILLFYLVQSSSKPAKRGIKTKIIDAIRKVGYKNGVLLTTALLYILLIIILVILTNAYVLIERGLSLFILLISLFISSNIIKIQKSSTNNKVKTKNNKYKTVCSTSIVLLVVLSYPIVSYSIDAYNSFPQSENYGLQFLTSDIPLNDKIITIGMPGQLSGYTKPPTNYAFTYKLQSISERQPDIIVFRNTDYFYMSMRRDLSFENNSYTRLYEEVNSSKLYDKIYASETFKIFIKNENSS